MLGVPGSAFLVYGSTILPGLGPGRDDGVVSGFEPVEE